MIDTTTTKWRVIRRIFLLLFACLAFLFVDFIGLTRPLAPVIGDAMDWKTRYLSGVHGVNCGRVAIRESASLETQCALQADAQSKSFRVIYNIQGMDSLVAGGVVRTPEGTLLSLSYDGCPAGCGFSLLHQQVRVKACPAPYHLYVYPNGRINCFQAGLSYPQNISSPKIEPY